MMQDEVIIDRIKEAVGSKLGFFVGAGISKDSSVPTFGELNKKVIESIGGEKLKADECILLSENIRPEVVLQIGVEELGQDVLISLEMLLGYTPNSNHFFLAEALKQGNWVFTTNQENLIEEACRLKGLEIKRCYEDLHFEEFVEKYRIDEEPDPKNIPGGYLFKLHGTIEEDKEGKERFKSILVALNQVGQGLKEAKRKVLTYFLKNYDFSFMGYRCQDDFSVYPVILDTDSKRSIFWLDHDRKWEGKLILDKEELEKEKKIEESKPPGEKRCFKTINVNAFLLKREESFKLVTDTSEYVRNKLWPIFKTSAHYNTFEQWAKNNIGEFKRNMFIGRLFEHLSRWSEAERHYKEAIDIVGGRKDREVMAKQRLADLYYRQDIGRKEDEAIEIYRKCIDTFKELENDFKVACLKVDIANVKRRQGDYEGSKKLAEEAEKELASIMKKSEEYELGYARCLNVLGLAHLRGSKEELEEGIKFCNESKEIKERLGDKNGVAESENAIGLLLTAQGRKLVKENQELSKEKFREALDSLKNALNIRMRYGFFRGCAQQCRNIGDVYRELMKIEEDKEKHLKDSEKSYNEGITYLRLIKPEAPIGEILHYNQRKAGLYADFVELTQDEGKKRNYNSKIVHIYKSEILLEGSPMIEEIKNNPVEFRNARNILERTKKSLEEMNLVSEAEEIDEMLEKLTLWIR